MAQRNIDIRPATPNDERALSSFLSIAFHMHKHLDWRTPEDWLPFQPFWLIVEGDQILAALSCPYDPPEVNWIRLFAVGPNIDRSVAWKLLFKKIYQNLLPEQEHTKIVAVSLWHWFADILLAHGFTHYQDIVVLEWNEQPLDRQYENPKITIREMKDSDMELVTQIDQTSFEPLWRNSSNAIKHSYYQSAYATIAEIDGKPVGYQICTQTPSSAHLARLAVLPEQQRKGIGYSLVANLLRYFTSRHIYEITVNTQSDNSSSLTLYKKIGFVRNNIAYPVYMFNPEFILDSGKI